MTQYSHGPILVSGRPYNAGTPLTALLLEETPAELVYVRNHFEIPTVDPDNWVLKISGSVRQPLSISLNEIKKLPSETVIMTLECAGNGRTSMSPIPVGTPWGINAISRVSFTGTSLCELLEKVGISKNALEVVFSGADKGEVEEGREEKYTRSLPLDIAMKPDTLIAWEMNGHPLSMDHGYPMRLIVPGWYGMASVKWLQEIVVVEEPFKGFFQDEHYVYLGEEGTEEGEPVRDIRVRSLIVQPETGATFEMDEIKIEGIAWTGEGEISRVDVSLDGGKSWVPAALSESSSPFGAKNWEHFWTPDKPGNYLLVTRGLDSNGNIQPGYQRWNRLGYGNNGIHSISIKIV